MTTYEIRRITIATAWNEAFSTSYEETLVNSYFTLDGAKKYLEKFNLHTMYCDCEFNKLANLFVEYFFDKFFA